MNNASLSVSRNGDSGNRIASKNGVIRNDIAPEMIFRMLAGSLRLLIKQYGMSGNAFDLSSESTILFDTWDTLFKIK